MPEELSRDVELLRKEKSDCTRPISTERVNEGCLPSRKVNDAKEPSPAYLGKMRTMARGKLRNNGT